jgi:hypothetical protein
MTNSENVTSIDAAAITKTKLLSGVVGLLLSYMLVPPQLPTEQKES